MTLKKKDRIQAVLENRAVDRIPVLSFATGYIAKLCGLSLLEYFTNPERCLEAQLSAIDLHGWDDSPGFGWADWGGGIFGGEVHFPSAYEQAAPRTRSFPVDTPLKALAIKAKAPLNTPMFSLQARFNSAAQKGGWSTKLRAGSVTSLVCAAVGMERFLLWTTQEPAGLKALYDKSADFLIRAARMMVDRFGPGLGAGISAPYESLISRDAFRKFVVPSQGRVNRELIEMGIRSFFLHLCGGHGHILKDWAELPWPDRIIVSADDRMDLEAVAAAFGNKHVVAGNVSTTKIAFGDYREVFDVSFGCLEKWSALPGGFVLMPACDMPVLAPPVNVHALVAASRRFA